jgi:hypothetical protein
VVSTASIALMQTPTHPMLRNISTASIALMQTPTHPMLRNSGDRQPCPLLHRLQNLSDEISVGLAGMCRLVDRLNAEMQDIADTNRIT